ncbi:MAG: hypothetical protein ACH37Z_09940 [Anaerolineae bacterium]|nr:hypothetical protein [Ardenticatenia bacterium]MBK8539218.1 hypothetical protein [Ardenticatenia bacterium]HRA20468.1 hypothetical protein [Anaerolineae bacterium]
MNEPSHSDSPTPDKPPADVASFVLRFSQDLWREAGGQPRVRWRGHIRHVQGDAETRFTDFSDAVAFMQRQLAQLTLESVAQDDAQGQAQALSESYQVWEKVTEGYRDVWLGAIRTAMDGTQAMRRQVGQQMERALPWWPFWPGGAARTAGGANAEDADSAAPEAGAAAQEVLDLLRGIHDQLTVLTERMRALEDRTGG